MKTEIGGGRLGSGNKQETSLKNYSRSTHDLGYLWRSSMASGTLVPFLSEIALPGDTMEINLNCDVKTLPTVGPLFGSYKVQLDVFECPMRLYNGKLHMNMLNVGLDMSKIYLPQIELNTYFDRNNKTDNAQINSSSIYSYLNMRGLGRSETNTSKNIKRNFNALPYLSYWDIYKNYYANKQEDRGYVIHASNWGDAFKMTSAILYGGMQAQILNNPNSVTPDAQQPTTLVIEFDFPYPSKLYGEPNPDSATIIIDGVTHKLTELFTNFEVGNVSEPGNSSLTLTCTGWQGTYGVLQTIELNGNPDNGGALTLMSNTLAGGLSEPQLTEFDLANIDQMRMDILSATNNSGAFKINKNSLPPYGLGLGNAGSWKEAYISATQEGLGIKTYQSDLFNNWISTEWIDGANGINEITSVSTAGNEFTIDALNLAQKVYVMLNRIAISGGSYDDWLEAAYTHERPKSVESPIYHGSLIKELGFEEVISNADTDINGNEQPLGTLAGRGVLSNKHKGGRIKIKTNEPAYIIGIVSITPRIDYSQGNKWDTNLITLNDLHKPELGAIGFQELVTDQMAWFDTQVSPTGKPIYKSMGKQPAWINYMTNVNQCRGNFAMQEKEMFMTLNRRYEYGNSGIDDLTTYVDPSKYNNIFAQTSIDSQNFWVQIAVNNTARRKMSAKVIPNL